MRRLIFFLLIAWIAFSWGGSAFAAPKPPKSICLSWTPGTAVSVIRTKPMGGRINTLSGRTKFYEVHGEMAGPGVGMPFSGAGHLLGTVFHFQLTGGIAPGTEVFTYTFEGAFDVAAGTGTGRYVYYGPAVASGQSGLLALTPVNCAAIVLPYTKSGTGETVTGDLFAP